MRDRNNILSLPVGFHGLRGLVPPSLAPPHPYSAFFPCSEHYCSDLWCPPGVL
jgi:hypothetical protein